MDPVHIEAEILQYQAHYHSRWLRQISAVAVIVVIFAARQSVGDEKQPLTGRWHNDFAQAAAEAKRLNKPLLVHFFADWCLPCKRMERDSLSNPALLQQLGRQFIGVKVNFDRQQELARRFNIRNLPGDVVLAPDGTILAQSSGYQTPENYSRQVAAANNLFAKLNGADPAIATLPSDAVGPSDTAGDRNRQTRWPLIVATPTARIKSPLAKPVIQRAVRVPKPPLGMEGYNPVALYNRRKWQKGLAKFAARYQGIEYRVNSVQELQQFLTTPERFAPRLLGCDPVVLQETDRALNGGTKHAAYFDGRLYLFINAKTRAKFKQHPTRYTRTQHVLLLEDEPVKKQSLRR